jgi:folate-binding protein YgfZ
MPKASYAILDGRGVIKVEGPDAATFLQALLSNDVTRTSAAEAVYAALLTAQGKFMHDVFVVAGREGFLLDCVHARRDDLLRRLSLYKLRASVELTDASDHYAVVALFGAHVAARLALNPEPGRARPIAGGIVYIDPRLAALGARALLPRERCESVLAEMGFTAAAGHAYEMHRLALGVPDGAEDMKAGADFLLECNGDALNAIDWSKGCYVGQEITARSRYRGTVRKRLVPVAIRGPLPPAGATITVAGDASETVAGEIRTVRDGRGIALLRLDCVDKPLRAGQAELRAMRPDWLPA